MDFYLTFILELLSSPTLFNVHTGADGAQTTKLSIIRRAALPPELQPPADSYQCFFLNLTQKTHKEDAAFTLTISLESLSSQLFLAKRNFIGDFSESVCWIDMLTIRVDVARLT